MYPHRIRLRGPWDCERADHSALQRVTLPGRLSDLGLTGMRGLLRFVRKFGYPGRIDEGEHVWLTCLGCTGVREVRLNGQLLAENPPSAFAFDVTSILTQRNRLEILVQAADDAGLWGEVAMEIRRDAYLADVQVQRTETSLQIVGQAIGTAPQPLELYTLVDNRNVDYRTIQPTPHGARFQIDLPAFIGQEHIIRLELIHVSTVWYAVELASRTP